MMRVCSRARNICCTSVSTPINTAATATAMSSPVMSAGTAAAMTMLTNTVVNSGTSTPAPPGTARLWQPG